MLTLKYKHEADSCGADVEIVAKIGSDASVTEVLDIVRGFMITAGYHHANLNIGSYEDDE